ncbi:FtsX-like permease family protein [Streptomyces sp. NPDC005808]|uniref:FtsX-like permease family protein n=1 Tax=Streptomyces sp. NPDC005808 TaxID=3364734 RepID=UPI00369F3939
MSSLRIRWASFLGSFVAVAVGVAVMTAMGLGLAASLGAPARAPERFASSPVVVMGRDTLTVEVQRGPGTALVSKKLAHPHPVDSELIGELRELGQVRLDGAARDAVGVDAPAAAVRELVGDRARVLTGEDRHQADPSAARDAEALVGVDSLLGTAAGVAAFVSVFVTASTFAFVVALRRREFGLLRLVGALPGQVRRLLLGEALAVGLMASTVGCALGSWAAPWLVRALVEGGVAPGWFALPGSASRLSWPLQVAFAVGVLVAVTGAWSASRQAARVGPLEALREASVDTGVMPWSRRMIGFTLLTVGLVLPAWTLGTDPAALLKRKTYVTQPMVLITAVAALAPVLVRPVVRRVRLDRLPGAVGLLIRANASTSVRRTAAVAAPVLVTVALAGSLLGSAATVTGAKAAEAREQTLGQLVVTGEGLEAVPVAGATVSRTAPTAVFVREEGTALIRSDARAVSDVAAFASLTRLPVVAGDVRDLDDRSIVVSEEWERHEVGSWVPVWLGDGTPTRLRVAAVLARGTGANGAYVTSANAPGATFDRLDVRVARGTDAATVASALRSAGGTVRSTSAWLAATHPRTGPQTRLGLLVVLGITLAYAVISLAGTLLMATSARRAELRSLRLAGATRGQVLGVVSGEAALGIGMGALLGGTVAGVNLAGLAVALGRLSAPVGVEVPWGVLAGCVGVCSAVGVGAAVAAAWRSR